MLTASNSTRNLPAIFFGEKRSPITDIPELTPSKPNFSPKVQDTSASLKAAFSLVAAHSSQYIAESKYRQSSMMENLYGFNRFGTRRPRRGSVDTLRSGLSGVSRGAKVEKDSPSRGALQADALALPERDTPTFGASLRTVAGMQLREVLQPTEKTNENRVTAGEEPERIERGFVMWTAKPSAFKSEVPELNQGLTILDLESKVTLAFAHARVDVEVSPSVIASMMTEGE